MNIRISLSLLIICLLTVLSSCAYSQTDGINIFNEDNSIVTPKEYKVKDSLIDKQLNNTIPSETAANKWEISAGINFSLFEKLDNKTLFPYYIKDETSNTLNFSLGYNFNENIQLSANLEILNSTNENYVYSYSLNTGYHFLKDLNFQTFYATWCRDIK
jgi:hypothetical protein